MANNDLKDSELAKVTGGDLNGEPEYEPDDDWCRNHCAYFEFRSFEDLSVPMSPKYCRNASLEGNCYKYHNPYYEKQR